MRIIRDVTYVSAADKGASAAIGNFDGVHLGHQSVIDIARAEGARIGAPLGIVTFEPHPRQYFAPDAPPFRLMSAAARAHRLEKLGVERLYELNFNTALSTLTPEQFARNVITTGLGLRHVVVGADFCFGKGRAGSVEDLKRFGGEMGFGVTVAELLHGTKGEVSSTAIRNALSEGRPRDAAAMLVAGLTVLAIDRSAAAGKALADRFPAETRDGRLTFRQADFATDALKLPTACLINASFCLPTCPPENFPALWAAIAGALAPGGLFAGHLYGPNDSWALRGDGLTIHTRESLADLFAGWEMVLDEEEESESVTPRGHAKHWHVFHIVARKGR